jgi:hypothetical protein
MYGGEEGEFGNVTFDILSTASAAPPPRPRSLSPNDYWSSNGLSSNGAGFNLTGHFDYYTPLFDPSSVWGTNMGHHGGAGTPDQLLVS